MNSQLIILLIGFIIVAIAGFQVAKTFQKIKFPLITGLIITGIVAGSSVLNFIPTTALPKLNFLNDIALAIIAFSAGSELYLKELRSRINAIKWMTIGQLVITFVLSSVVVYYVADKIPFMAELSNSLRFAIAILFGTIFVARSPSSAIAVINEMRANGPFTKTAMGVTVVKDVLVIILFAICFAVAKAMVHGEKIGVIFLLILVFELFTSFMFGILIGKLLQIPLSIKMPQTLKAILITLLGWGVYLFAAYIKNNTEQFFHHEIVLEPLLMCIIGSFYVTNYSKNRIEFVELLEEISPIIYIVFFTLTGASLSLQTLVEVFWVALALFFLRLLTMVLGGIFGVIAAKDDKKYTWISWMPYVTQAGVALGLTTIIATEFPEWGYQFQTIIIAIIVINQLIGPPLFKAAINLVGESHLKKETAEFDGVKDVVIFGLESQSIALAKQLKSHNWVPKIIAVNQDFDNTIKDCNIVGIYGDLKEKIASLSLDSADAIVCMLSDDENYIIAETIYETIGTRDIVVRLNKRENFDKFHKLNALIIHPSLAMVSLLDHLVRAPNAASLLLGMDENQDTIDVEIRNQDIHGLTLRDLRFPTDIIVLSIKRSGNVIISHGYTRLRLGDIVTLVGSTESLENVSFKLNS